MFFYKKFLYASKDSVLLRILNPKKEISSSDQSNDTNVARTSHQIYKIVLSSYPNKRENKLNTNQTFTIFYLLKVVRVLELEDSEGSFPK